MLEESSPLNGPQMRSIRQFLRCCDLELFFDKFLEYGVDNEIDLIDDALFPEDDLSSILGLSSLQIKAFRAAQLDAQKCSVALESGVFGARRQVQSAQRAKKASRQEAST